MTPPSPDVAHCSLDELLDRACSGDTAAANQMFDLYAPHFVRVIRRMLRHPVRRILDTDVILQDMRMAALRSDPEAVLAMFKSRESFVGFFTTMAKNRITDANRHYLGRQKTDLNRDMPLDNVQEGADKALVDPAPSPMHQVALRHDWDEFLGTLKPIRRAIVRLVVTGHKVKEIAAQLGVKAHVVRYQLNASKQAIAKWWNSWDENVPVESRD